MKNFDSVFDAHPDANQIFVVDNMPFINSNHARAHANSVGKDVEIVTRPAKSGGPDDTGENDGGGSPDDTGENTGGGSPDDTGEAKAAPAKKKTSKRTKK